MTIYYVIYLLLGITPIVSNNLQQKEDSARKTFCVIAFLSLFLMFALRHMSMGLDLKYTTSYGYLGRFLRITSASWSDIFNPEVAHYEKGYVIFNKIIGTIHKDRQFFLGACAFFTILPIIYVIYKKSESPFQSVIIYMGLPVFLLTYSGIRQALAIGICFLAFLYIEDKKIVKFALLVILAMLFHRSAIIFFIAYPLYHLKMSVSVRWASVVLMPVVFVLKRPLFAIFSKIFKENAVAKNTGAGTLFIIFALIYVFCMLYSDGSKEQNGLLNLFLMACLCQAFGGIYDTAVRVAYYFMLSLVILIPNVIEKMDSNLDKPIFKTAVVVAFGAFGLYSIYKSTWAMAYPYFFYWEI